jgi:hypothetical protein
MKGERERTIGLGVDGLYVEQVAGDPQALAWLEANDPGTLAKIRRKQADRARLALRPAGRGASPPNRESSEGDAG